MITKDRTSQVDQEQGPQLILVHGQKAKSWLCSSLRQRRPWLLYHFQTAFLLPLPSCLEAIHEGMTRS